MGWSSRAMEALDGLPPLPPDPVASAIVPACGSGSAELPLTERGVPSALLILDARGTVVAWSGEPALVGRADVDASARPGVGDLIRPLEGEDLPGLVAQIASMGRSAPPRSLLVRPADETHAGALRLDLHPLGAGFVAAVLSTGTPASGAERFEDAAVERAWARLGAPMVLTTPGDGPDGPIMLRANRAFADLFGAEPESMEGRALIPLVSPQREVDLLRAVRLAVDARDRAVSEIMVDMPGRERAVLEWEVAPVEDAEGRVHRLISVFRPPAGATPAKVTPHRRDVDRSTGLPNEIQFVSRLERLVERVAQTQDYGFAVVGVELADLQAVQAGRGSRVSDSVIEALAWRIGRKVRPGDLIARVTERRLAVLLDDFGSDDSIDEMVQRIRKTARAPYTIGGERIHVATVGAAAPAWGPDHRPADALQVLDALERAVSQARSEEEGAV